MKNCPYGKNVLITGASSGIGLSAALLFARNGFTVYAISRHCEEKIEDFDGGGKIVPIRCDVTDEVSVKNAVSKIDVLNIVIHCAGFGISGSAECTPISEARKQMDTNYFGVMNVNANVLPLLRKHDRSLVLFTSSFAALVPIPFQSHYSSSKYALEAYAEALGIEAKTYGVRVCIVEPGDTKTGFTKARTMNEPETSVYYDKCNQAVGKMAQSEINGKKPESVARIFFKQAYRKHPKTRIVVGFSYKVLAFLVRILPVRFRDFILGKMY